MNIGQPIQGKSTHNTQGMQGAGSVPENLANKQPVKPEIAKKISQILSQQVEGQLSRTPLGQKSKPSQMPLPPLPISVQKMTPPQTAPPAPPVTSSPMMPQNQKPTYAPPPPPSYNNKGIQESTDKAKKALKDLNDLTTMLEKAVDQRSKNFQKKAIFLKEAKTGRFAFKIPKGKDKKGIQSGLDSFKRTILENAKNGNYNAIEKFKEQLEGFPQLKRQLESTMKQAGQLQLFSQMTLSEKKVTTGIRIKELTGLLNQKKPDLNTIKDLSDSLQLLSDTPDLVSEIMMDEVNLDSLIDSFYELSSQIKSSKRLTKIADKTGLANTLDTFGSFLTDSINKSLDALAPNYTFTTEKSESGQKLLKIPKPTIQGLDAPQRVRTEIAITEKTYNDGLQQLQSFITGIKDNKKMAAKFDAKKPGGLTIEQLSHTIETIKLVSDKLVAATHDSEEEPISIYGGDDILNMESAMQSFQDSFSYFSTYLSNYTEINNGLVELIGDNTLFKEHVERFKSDPKNRGRSWGAFLIMPAQRSPRYKLLFADLGKQIGKQIDKQGDNYPAPERSYVEKYAKFSDEITIGFNESNRNHERLRKLQS